MQSAANSTVFPVCTTVTTMLHPQCRTRSYNPLSLTSTNTQHALFSTPHARNAVLNVCGVFSVLLMAPACFEY
eukprot:3427541-Amphidinium_carterae.1